MGLVNRIVAIMIARMSERDKHQLIEDMTERFLADMTVEEKQKILGNILDKFFADMTTEDKKKIMSEVTPHMMEGFNMAVIMPQMMGAMMGISQQKDGMAGIMPMMANVTGKSKESTKTETKTVDDVRKPKGGKK